MAVTPCNALSYLNGEDVSCIQIKLNQLVSENVHVITAYLSVITSTNISRSFTYKMATETTGIDMEQNYVTVTLCIINWQHGDAAIVRCGPSVRRSINFYDRGFVASGFDERDFSEYRAFWSRWLRGP